MNDLRDPLLAGKEITVSEPELRTEEVPTKFNSIPQNVMLVVQAYLQLIWRLKPDKGKKIPFNEVIENTNYLFTLTGKDKDALWKEHSAANLREMIDKLLFPDDYCRAIKNISEDESSHGGLYDKIYKNKEILSFIVHYRRSSAIIKVNEKYEGETSNENISDDIYERICIDFIYSLYNLFKKYAFNESQKK